MDGINSSAAEAAPGRCEPFAGPSEDRRGEAAARGLSTPRASSRSWSVSRASFAKNRRDVFSLFLKAVGRPLRSTCAASASIDDVHGERVAQALGQLPIILRAAQGPVHHDQPGAAAELEKADLSAIARGDDSPNEGRA